jgi:hypothetical protein
MADSGGHWSTLAEAQKLTQSTKIPGVFETDIKRNNPLDRIPVAQAAHSGKSIKFLREAVTLEDEVQDLTVGEKLTWTENVTYTEVEVELKIKAIQRKLDNFVRDIYGTYNDYRAQVLLEMEKGLKRKIGDAIIYDDTDFGGSQQFDGLHAFASENSGNYNIDNGETGLSLENLRNMVDDMKLGVDELWFPYPIKNRLNAAYEEKGFAGLASGTAGALGMVTRGINDVGKQILFWDGIPIVPTDYLVAEQANTGAGSNARAKYSSGTKMYSIFAVHFGNVMERDPGFCLAYGGTEGLGDFYKLVAFPNLEDYDAEGMRMVSYVAMLYSSKFAVGRIYDITDTAVTV